MSIREEEKSPIGITGRAFWFLIDLN